MSLRHLFLAAAAALPVSAGVGAPAAEANIQRAPSWGTLPPAGRQPQVVITFLATGGHQLFCYGDNAIGGRDTWWCFNPNNSIEGYLQVSSNTTWVLYNRGMGVACQFHYDGNVAQPVLRAGQSGWGGTAFCAERRYHIYVHW